MSWIRFDNLRQLRIIEDNGTMSIANMFSKKKHLFLLEFHQLSSVVRCKFEKLYLLKISPIQNRRFIFQKQVRLQILSSKLWTLKSTSHWVRNHLDSINLLDKTTSFFVCHWGKLSARVGNKDPYQRFTTKRGKNNSGEMPKMGKKEVKEQMWMREEFEKEDWRGNV